MRTPLGRRYLTQMRYRPRARSVGDLIAASPTGTARKPARRVGTVVAQPRVNSADRPRVVLLDEVLGDGWSLLGVDLSPADWHELTAHPGVRQLDARRVAISLDGRRRHAGVPPADGLTQ
jgi:3-(3-hydroxy-phenyl)propionate hydroxylase